MLKIGEFSKLAQVSVKTLRHYDKLKLLQPAWIDRFTGYRYYTPEQLPRLNRILALKDLGFSLEQIRHVLKKEWAAEELRGLLRLKQTELERHIETEQLRLQRVETRLRQIAGEGALPAYDIVLKRVPPLRVVGIRATLPDYRTIPALCAELVAYLDRHAIASDPTRPFLALYYDAEYREREVDIEVAAPVSRALPGTTRVAVHTLPGAETVACAVHQGGPETLPQAYNALLTWIELNGYTIAGPNREVYLQRAPAPALTEVQFPVTCKPISHYLLTQKERKMEPRIVTKPAFNVLGLKYYGKNEHNEIKAMWGEFNARIQEILDAGSEPGMAYGVCSAEMAVNGEFYYLAGLEMQRIDAVPEGMEQWEVPAQTYAVFPCTLPTIGEAYQYAFETWLPQSGYQRAPGPDFEYYDEDFDPHAPNSELSIYIPITK